MIKHPSPKKLKTSVTKYYYFFFSNFFNLFLTHKLWADKLQVIVKIRMDVGQLLRKEFVLFKIKSRCHMLYLKFVRQGHACLSWPGCLFSFSFLLWEKFSFSRFYSTYAQVDCTWHLDDLAPFLLSIFGAVLDVRQGALPPLVLALCTSYESGLHFTG